MGTEVFDIDYHRQMLAKSNNLVELEKSYAGIYPEIEISTSDKWDVLSEMESVPEVRIKRLQRVSKIIPPNVKILDIGAGWGDIIPILESKYGNSLNYTGIDFSPKVIKKLILKYPKYRFLCTTVDKINEEFDVILALEILEHIVPSKVLNFLKQIKMILKKSGNLIVDVPINEDLKNSTFICGNCGKPSNKMGHVRIYSSELIKAELQLTGYSIVYKELMYLGYYGLKGFIKRKIRNFLGKLIGPSTIKKVEAGCIILKCRNTL